MATVSLTARASSQPMVTIYRLMSRDIFPSDDGYSSVYSINNDEQINEVPGNSLTVINKGKSVKGAEGKLQARRAASPVTRASPTPACSSR
ncbi:hypothetical protein BRI6_1400 [plant metagenome]